MANGKSLQTKAEQLNSTLEQGQFYRNGNGITFEVIELSDTTITLRPRELQNSNDSRLGRSVFCQLYARNNYELIKDPNSSREFELTKKLGLKRFAIQ
jgi:hypothetical protein